MQLANIIYLWRTTHFWGGTTVYLTYWSLDQVVILVKVERWSYTTNNHFKYKTVLSSCQLTSTKWIYGKDWSLQRLSLRGYQLMGLSIIMAVWKWHIPNFLDGYMFMFQCFQGSWDISETQQLHHPIMKRKGFKVISYLWLILTR